MPDNLQSTTRPVTDKVAFPVLSPSELEQLRPFGTPCSYEDGETIFRAAEEAINMFIIESGAMEILNPVDDNRSIVTHGPGQFSGDIDLLTRRPPLVTGVARGRTHLTRISGGRIRELLNKVPHFGETLLAAAQERRRLL